MRLAEVGSQHNVLLPGVIVQKALEGGQHGNEQSRALLSSQTQ